MGIARGEEWGTRVSVEPGWPIVATDAELAARPLDSPSPVWLVGGDLARTLGVEGREPPSEGECTVVALDLFRVVLDDSQPVLGAAHVLIGPSRLVPKVAVMNAAFAGPANMAPRAHPGDGRLDVVRFDLGLVDRIKARRRLGTGSHLPHPGIAATKHMDWSTDLDRATPVSVDAKPIGSAKAIRVQTLADAVRIAI